MKWFILALFIQVGTSAWAKLDNILAIQSNIGLESSRCPTIILIKDMNQEICSDWTVSQVIEALAPFIQKTKISENSMKKEKHKQ